MRLQGILWLIGKCYCQAQLESKEKQSANIVNSFTDAVGDDDAEISINQIKKDTGFTTSAAKSYDTQKLSTLYFDIILRSQTTMNDGASKISSKPSSSLASNSGRLHQSSSKRQELFQPGSLPVHIHRRYMIWNNVGTDRCFGEDGDQSTSSIEVEFHNSSIPHGLHIPNTLGHTMAALSNQALLLACPA